MTINNTNEAALLNEIFIKPSQAIKTDHFQAQNENDELRCSGKCSTNGTCLPCTSG